jgi:dihydropteroate synthase
LSSRDSYRALDREIEHVRVVAVIEAIRKLVDVRGKVTQRNFVVLADDAALKQRPKRLY